MTYSGIRARYFSGTDKDGFAIRPDGELRTPVMIFAEINANRWTDRFTISGNYTWSQLDGNINGETAGSGPTSTSPLSYPEYAEASWNYPVGPLLADQEHKFRIWGIYDVLDNLGNALPLRERTTESQPPMQLEPAAAVS